MVDPVALHAELTTDPASVGYATDWQAGNDYNLTALINSATGPGAGTVTLPFMTNAEFVTAFLPYLPNIAGLVQAKQTIYWKIWSAILAMPVIYFNRPNISGMLTQAVADGVLTSAQAAALTQRTGSRAEVLFGAGTSVTTDDIVAARKVGP